MSTCVDNGDSDQDSDNLSVKEPPSRDSLLSDDYEDIPKGHNWAIIRPTREWPAHLAIEHSDSEDDLSEELAANIKTTPRDGLIPRARTRPSSSPASTCQVEATPNLKRHMEGTDIDSGSPALEHNLRTPNNVEATQRVRRLDPDTARILFLQTAAARRHVQKPEITFPSSLPDCVSSPVEDRPPRSPSDGSVKHAVPTFIEETPFRLESMSAPAVIDSQTPLKRPRRDFEAEASVQRRSSSNKKRKRPVSYPTNRVATQLQTCRLAKWQGRWYPATVQTEDLSQSGTLAKIVPVLFSFAQIAPIKLSDTKQLSLSPGDVVCFGGVRQHYKISRAYTKDEQEPFSTARGHDRLVIYSLGSDGEISGDPIDVAVRNVYMTNQLLENHEERRKESDDDGLSSLVGEVYAPPMCVFGDNDKRHADKDHGVAKRGRSLTEPGYYDDDSFSDHSDKEVGLALSQELAQISYQEDSRKLMGCVFALTLEDSDAALRFARAIEKQGGRVLNGGPADAFDIDRGVLAARPALSRTFFGAVIATKPLKTGKYLQALALGWPCLSYKYILDILSGTLDDYGEWQGYQLAAGVSNSLKAEVSQDTTAFTRRWASGYTLAEQHSRRRVSLGSILPPIFLVDKGDNQAIQFLLLAAAANSPKVVKSAGAVPSGSVLIYADRRVGGMDTTTSALRAEMRQLMRLDETVCFTREWLIQCVINQRIV